MYAFWVSFGLEMLFEVYFAYVCKQWADQADPEYIPTTAAGQHYNQP